MTINILQSGNSGTTALATGVVWNLPNKTQPGSTVVLAARMTSDIVPTSIAGLGAASWINLNGVKRGNFSSNISWWYAANLPGGASDIAINLVSVTNYSVAWEINGNGTPISGGTNNVTNGQSGTLTLTGLATGYMLLVGMLTGAALTSSPTSPWTLYNTGGFTETLDQDVATQITTGSTNQTATWQTTGTNTAWGVAGLIVPAATTPTYGGSFMSVIAGA